MGTNFYPREILELPEVEVAFAGVRGYLLQGPAQQAVFFEIEPFAEVEPHSHAAQWGVVLDGELELTIGEDTRSYRKGDCYYIPAGMLHSARFLSRTRVLDFFADAHRYAVKQAREGS